MRQTRISFPLGVALLTLIALIGGLAPPATAVVVTHSCTSALAFPAYSTCQDLFANNPLLDSGCYSLDIPQTVDPLDTRDTQCQRVDVLVMPVDNDPVACAAPLNDLLPPMESVRDFYERATYGAVSIPITAAEIAPWFCQAGSSNAMYSQQALEDLYCNQGWDLSGFERIVTVWSDWVSGFGASGVGDYSATNITLNCPVGGPPAAVINPTLVQIKGKGNFKRGLISHELGHTFNFEHAKCQSSQTGAQTNKGDKTTTMGGCQLGHFASGQLEDSGWLPADQIHEIDLAANPGALIETAYLDDLGDAATDIAPPTTTTKSIWIHGFPSGQEFFLDMRRLDGPDGGDLTTCGAEGIADGVAIRSRFYTAGHPHSKAFDATVETPFSEFKQDGVLLEGRNYKLPDDTRDVYVTLVEDDDHFLLLSIWVDPLGTNLEPTIVTDVTATLCTVAMACTPHNTEVLGTGETWRFTVEAEDSDGSYLSYFWNFEVDQGQPYLPGLHGGDSTIDLNWGNPHVATIDHWFPGPPVGRVSVLVSDRVGGEVSSGEDLGGYINAAPTIGSLVVSQTGPGKFIFGAGTADTELLFHDWSMDGTNLHFPTPQHVFASKPAPVLGVAWSETICLDVSDLEFTTNSCWPIDLNQEPVPVVGVGIPAIGFLDLNYPTQTPMVVPAGSMVTLNASASWDPDPGAPGVTFRWMDTCGLTAVAPMDAVQKFPMPMGPVNCQFSLSVFDGDYFGLWEGRLGN